METKRFIYQRKVGRINKQKADNYHNNKSKNKKGLLKWSFLRCFFPFFVHSNWGWVLKIFRNKKSFKNSLFFSLMRFFKIIILLVRLCDIGRPLASSWLMIFICFSSPTSFGCSFELFVVSHSSMQKIPSLSLSEIKSPLGTALLPVTMLNIRNVSKKRLLTFIDKSEKKNKEKKGIRKMIKFWSILDVFYRGDLMKQPLFLVW